jgi:hypothetical protein
MLRKLSGFIVALLLSASVHAAGGESAPMSINLAGEQRMLSQRIAKAYAQIGLNVMPNTASVQMKDAIGRFESNLATLESVVADQPAARTAHQRLAASWAVFRAAAAAPISRESALALSNLSIDVLDAADRLAQLIADEASSRATSRIVNLAGRQRMLSQRLAKAYMLRSWGADSAPVRDEIALVSREFPAGLEALMALGETTPEIRLELEEIALQWEWLQAAISAEGALSFRLVVAEAADSILDASDRVTRLYEQLGRP